jgi:hypothetical protein
MTPTGTVKPRARAGTAAAEGTGRAVSSEHLLIVDTGPFLKREHAAAAEQIALGEVFCPAGSHRLLNPLASLPAQVYEGIKKIRTLPPHAQHRANAAAGVRSNNGDSTLSFHSRIEPHGTE